MSEAQPQALPEAPTEESEDDAEETGAVVPQESVTVTLVYPIQFGERSIASLTLRPLTAKDMRRSSARLDTLMAQKTILEYVGYLSGEPAHIVDLLSAPDAIVLIGAVSGFFAASHATGKK